MLAAALACGAVILGFFYFGNLKRGNSHISPIDQIRLTTGGRASQAVIAPDGETVVYTENGEVKTSSLSNGSSRVLVAAAAPDLSYISLAVSPDAPLKEWSEPVNNAPVIKEET